jgi:hypothetical protein
MASGMVKVSTIGPQRCTLRGLEVSEGFPLPTSSSGRGRDGMMRGRVLMRGI